MQVSQSNYHIILYNVFHACGMTDESPAGSD